MYSDTSDRRFRDTSSAEHLITFIGRVIDGVRHICCGALRGHEMMTHREPERLALQCLHCGFTTPGWSIGVEGRYRRTAAPIVPIEERMRASLTTRWLRPPQTTHRAA
jgi:hypothetical protein